MPRLIDEPASRQDQQIADLGGDLYVDQAPQEEDEEPSWGADPCNILMFREENGYSLDD